MTFDSTIHNSSQYYPLPPAEEVLDQDLYTAKQVQNARKVFSQPIQLVQQDQQSSFDEENDLKLKKEQKYLKAFFATAIPKLASLDVVFPVEKLSELDEEEEEPVAEEPEILADSKLDEAYYKAAHMHREGLKDSANYNVEEIIRRHKLIHDLHAEKEQLLEKLSKRMEKSGNLGWIHSLLNLGGAGLSVFYIVFGIATGGLGIPIIAALQGALTTVNGAIGAENQLLNLKSQKDQGDVQVLSQEQDLENKKIEEDSHNRQKILNLIHKLIETELQIVKNRNYTRVNY